MSYFVVLVFLHFPFEHKVGFLEEKMFFLEENVRIYLNIFTWNTLGLFDDFTALHRGMIVINSLLVV